MRHIALLLLLAACASTAAAPPPSLESAVRTLRGGDPATARSMLEALTRQDPKSAPAWRALGSAYQQLHEPRRAL